jgi:hypothetical protein
MFGKPLSAAEYTLSVNVSIPLPQEKKNPQDSQEKKKAGTRNVCFTFLRTFSSKRIRSNV